MQRRDPDGRTVLLTPRAWRHILSRHEELGINAEAILDIVAQPDRRAYEPTTGEEWFYRSGIGPSRWIRVVVHYEADSGRVTTAFPRRRFP